MTEHTDTQADPRLGRLETTLMELQSALSDAGLPGVRSITLGQEEPAGPGCLLAGWLEPVRTPVADPRYKGYPLTIADVSLRTSPSPLRLGQVSDDGAC